MKFLRNPISGEIVAVSPLRAKSLFRYGWRYTDRKAWIEQRQAQVRAAMIRNMPAARAKHGRMQ